MAKHGVRFKPEQIVLAPLQIEVLTVRLQTVSSVGNLPLITQPRPIHMQ